MHFILEFVQIKVVPLKWWSR